VSVEHVPVRILEDHRALAIAVARRIAEVMAAARAAGRRPVLGLATGSTPVGVYRELVRMHREEGLSFAEVVTFNLDEYVPMDPESPHSYHRYMREHFFDHVDLDPADTHVPRGDLPRDALDVHCAEYDEAIRAAGGIDFQLLGIGRSGHVGFNEPGSARDSRTRVVWLDTVTRRDAASDFFGEENVPAEAVTMGVASILETREVALLATGEHKAAVVRRAVEGPVHPDVAATYLQEHPNAVVYLDPAASAELTRVKTPWLVGEVDWTPTREVGAVLWLSRCCERSVLRLTTADYRDHHLSALVARHGSAEPLNGRAFNHLISRIRGRSALPRDRRVLVFSPHPDDDVISMGGLLRKLVQNGNDVTVAYQTSGNIAVFDHEVRRYLDFLRRGGRRLGGEGVDLGVRADELEALLAAKRSGEPDAEDIREIKRVIRETEAVSALESLGLGADDALFLDLPFYRTGLIRKDPLGEEDVERTLAALARTRPEIVCAAGDLSDPHGTHRVCLEAVEAALERYEGEPPEVWYYRGAWQEWPVAEADVLVPLSEGELRAKILAIFKHQSQKDRAPFPGADEREFWQRVEARNRGTAAELERLGLPAYYAMEAYVVRRAGEPPPVTPVPTRRLADAERPAAPDAHDRRAGPT
jgi:glucosamine-6-phosphate deaminase